MNIPIEDMRQVNIKNFQKNLSKELKTLPVTVTCRNKPIAVVVDPKSVTPDGVCTGEGSLKDVLASKGLTKERKRVVLKNIIENPKTRDADKVKAIAEDNRLDSSMNDTGNKSGRFGGDEGAELIKQLLKAQREAKAEVNRMIRKTADQLEAKVQTLETSSGRTVGVLYILPNGELHPDSWIECAEDAGPRDGDSGATEDAELC